MVDAWRRVDGWQSARIYSDEENIAFIRKKYDWLLPTFLQYSKQVQRADIARLARLHLHGGVYSDLDTSPCSSKREYLQESVIGSQLLTLVRLCTPSVQRMHSHVPARRSAERYSRR